MTKAELRKIYLEKRKQLSENTINELSKKIAHLFFLQFNPTENQNIHCFIPIKKFKEVNTLPLIESCFSKKINVFVPKVINTEMIAIELKENTQLSENKWGILEPSENTYASVTHFDYIITPLLYCDRKGNRIGYGKGFYDELFSTMPTTTKKIGVNFFSPLENIDDLRNEDISLDYLITPSEILSF
ncbi:5-formyltetrahydrofolate cyclo-ligase [Riemerella anatipestifer]|uniref:5-formyltetrahydrofolate cyclo-ligase n=1 Tax=Riemerella anatipestifer TaxID=34085 RepID=UPI00069C86F4|nr:5-formyltetrahydrofolate cyclo-ligase [Riemerella anatipestifer]MDY3317091.1 5-formyltetrahydrofolate cyclo-ligase [Riemerella anatipestifer]MDY3317910.1 5-formyltetrahydrofolate cyclo-ligase [Riemerella anatipestifer]MDY3324173.1 5-formyltetrahydrofolate cyclo-ligase [Riemerella anatipestifer]MDY3351558.1 5-formyltetrahydrofolate cyclo-ligase [Riemerella anatipestifer]MDY3352988.1 5-formyltetrahydrofolate cyclo-ligase [Riemerella anatipestifer]